MSFEDSAAGRRFHASRRYLNDRIRLAVDALEHLVGGLSTSLLALGGLAHVIGIGIFLPSPTLRMVRAVANRERDRLSRWGPPVVNPGPVPAGLRDALRDYAVRRELGWLAVHAFAGFLIGLLALVIALYALQGVTFPLWFWLLPPGSHGPGLLTWRIDGFLDALGAGVLGIGWLAVGLAVGPGMARLQARPGRRLLAPPPGADLSLRVAQLTATRAGALDAHAAELRRIERSLHDGTQNRLVAVNVLLGAARRALARDPESATAVLERAQDAAEQALAELRTVVRGILPPVLADRGLTGALNGLAASSAVPCRVDIDMPGRCATSVEATAYFVVAEALTNVNKHSGATAATVTVRSEGGQLLLLVSDDGHGGAAERDGSGITGIRQRVEAYDGRFSLTSPPGGPTTIQVELPCGS
ncbi:sensor histidine kinase [Micromonospora sp. DT68]|uniref:sensor histidine kinase n=1 Tax=Micromonospora TaxID=1873 RepID=UPI0033B89581